MNKCCGDNQEYSDKIITELNKVEISIANQLKKEIMKELQIIEEQMLTKILNELELRIAPLIMEALKKELEK